MNLSAVRTARAIPSAHVASAFDHEAKFGEDSGTLMSHDADDVVSLNHAWKTKTSGRMSNDLLVSAHSLALIAIKNDLLTRRSHLDS
jgi:hypothetical protein